MRDQEVSGGALILGAVAAMTTMVFHPSGGEILTAGDGGAHAARVGVMAHALALAAFPVLLTGTIGLSRRVSGDRFLSILTPIVYGLALVAAISATVFSGLVGTEVAQRVATSDGARLEALEALLLFTGLANRAFAGVFVVASSGAVLLWSIEILARRTFPPAIGVAGAAISTLTLLAYLTGHARLDVHGFGILIFAQSMWLIAAGVALIQAGSAPNRQRSSAPAGPDGGIVVE